MRDGQPLPDEHVRRLEQCVVLALPRRRERLHSDKGILIAQACTKCYVKDAATCQDATGFGTLSWWASVLPPLHENTTDIMSYLLCAAPPAV